MVFVHFWLGSRLQKRPIAVIDAADFKVESRFGEPGKYKHSRKKAPDRLACSGSPPGPAWDPGAATVSLRQDHDPKVCPNLCVVCAFLHQFSLLFFQADFFALGFFL